MNPILTSLVCFVYFFVAGIIFRDMLDEVKTGPSSWWPITGSLLLSVFWLVLVLWAVANIFSWRTTLWYLKFASTIFEHNIHEDKSYEHSAWGRSKF